MFSSYDTQRGVPSVIICCTRIEKTNDTVKLASNPSRMILASVKGDRTC